MALHFLEWIVLCSSGNDFFAVLTIYIWVYGNKSEYKIKVNCIQIAFIAHLTRDTAAYTGALLFQAMKKIGGGVYEIILKSQSTQHTMENSILNDQLTIALYIQRLAELSNDDDFQKPLVVFKYDEPTLKDIDLTTIQAILNVFERKYEIIDSANEEDYKDRFFLGRKFTNEEVPIFAKTASLNSMVRSLQNEVYDLVNPNSSVHRDVLAFGDLIINKKSSNLYFRGKQYNISLKIRPIQFLLSLLQERGRVVTYIELAKMLGYYIPGNDDSKEYLNSLKTTKQDLKKYLIRIEMPLIEAQNIVDMIKSSTNQGYRLLPLV